MPSVSAIDPTKQPLTSHVTLYRLHRSCKSQVSGCLSCTPEWICILVSDLPTDPTPARLGQACTAVSPAAHQMKPRNRSVVIPESLLRALLRALRILPLSFPGPLKSPSMSNKILMLCVSCPLAIMRGTSSADLWVVSMTARSADSAVQASQTVAVQNRGRPRMQHASAQKDFMRCSVCSVWSGLSCLAVLLHFSAHSSS